MKPSRAEDPSALEVSDRRRVSQDQRRAAILAAALEVFSENGFAMARLDDVAHKAGVAKGTLYLYFPDKEALFEQLLTSLASPLLQRLEALSTAETLPADAVLSQILTLFQTQVLGTPRERILRLIIAEGPRFPRIAELYHREIISKGREFIRKIATRGHERGELPSDALARFPQLFFAPLMVAVIWSSLFGAFDPLDVNGLIEAHRRLIFGLDGQEKSQ
jgi:AcrR family transcriptional regulator